MRSVCPVCSFWLVCPVCAVCPGWPVCPDDHRICNLSILVQKSQISYSCSSNSTLVNDLLGPGNILWSQSEFSAFCNSCQHFLSSWFLWTWLVWNGKPDATANQSWVGSNLQFVSKRFSTIAYSHIGQIPITTTSKMQGVILRPWFLCVMGMQQQIQMSYTEKYLQLSSQIQLFNFGYCIKLVTGLWMAIASPRSFTKNARSASTMTLHILCSPPLALSRV